MDKVRKHQHLPLDIVHEILLSLPIRTLIRFKSVSKQCYSLISQPSFQQDHFRRNSQQDPFLLLTSINDFNEVSDTTTLHLTTYDNHGESLVNEFSISVPHRFVYPLTTLSCRGLVCFFTYGGEQVLLCNPSTREIITLPPTSEFNHNVGFGYAASTEEFKVFRFFKHKDYHCCEVFTLGGSGWREARCPFLQNPDTFIWGAPFFHGAMHFLPGIDDNNTDENADIFIEAFDIESEECRKIQLPLSYHSVRDNPDYVCMYVTELGGNLCLAFDFNTTLELWLLKDYDSGEWVKEYTIDFTSLGSVVWGDALRTMGDGRILMNILFAMNSLLYWYNPWDKTFTQKTTEKYSTALYVENLLSLKALCNNIESRGCGGI